MSLQFVGGKEGMNTQNCGINEAVKPVSELCFTVPAVLALRPMIG